MCLGYYAMKTSMSSKFGNWQLASHCHCSWRLLMAPEREMAISVLDEAQVRKSKISKGLHFWECSHKLRDWPVRVSHPMSFQWRVHSFLGCDMLNVICLLGELQITMTTPNLWLTFEHEVEVSLWFVPYHWPLLPSYVLTSTRPTSPLSTTPSPIPPPPHGLNSVLPPRPWKLQLLLKKNIAALGQPVTHECRHNAFHEINNAEPSTHICRHSGATLPSPLLRPLTWTCPVVSQGR